MISTLDEGFIMYIESVVTKVHHWNDELFSFKVARPDTFRYTNGHFVMLGIEIEGKVVTRAYSIVSPNYEPELEFLSIKVQTGLLTSHLQHINVGDKILIGAKSTGSLIVDYLLPGRNLYLYSTGTGIAPFISIIQDIEVYRLFEKIVLIHGVRHKSDLAYHDDILYSFYNKEPYLSELMESQLIYYPTVTRDEYINQGRVTDIIGSKYFYEKLSLPYIDSSHDRAMICGSPSMIRDITKELNSFGFNESKRGYQAQYVIERAFVEK